MAHKLDDGRHDFPGSSNFILKQVLIWEISDKAKSWSWWQVTAYITQELRESVRFLERIYTYDELRLHSMILGLQVCRNLDDDFAVAVQKVETYPCISLQPAYI